MALFSSFYLLNAAIRVFGKVLLMDGMDGWSFEYLNGVCWIEYQIDCLGCWCLYQC